MSLKYYEFKVTFRNLKEVDTYRVFKVDNITSLANFGISIVLSFNGDCSHLFQFKSNDQSYTIYKDDFTGRNLSAFHHNVENLGVKSNFYYDFGDSWEFDIELLKVYDHSGDIVPPHVIEGNGLGFIEDIGGTTGLLRAYKKAPKKFEKINIKNINDTIEMEAEVIEKEFYKASGYFDDLNDSN